MEIYKNFSNQKGVIMYEIGENSITLNFKKDSYDNGKVYSYSTKYMLKENVEYMCELAKSGKGLRSFINSERTRHLVTHDKNR